MRPTPAPSMRRGPRARSWPSWASRPPSDAGAPAGAVVLTAELDHVAHLERARAQPLRDAVGEGLLPPVRTRGVVRGGSIRSRGCGIPRLAAGGLWRVEVVGREDR